MRYERNRRGARQWLLHSRDLRKVLRHRAEQGAAFARGIAPVGATGRYLAGIRVQDGPILPALGDMDARQTVWIHATADHSAAVEWGNASPRVRAQHVLGRIIPLIHDARPRRS